MKPIINRIFIDSSVLIEPLHGRKTEFYLNMVLNKSNQCCINSVIVSEYLYHFLGSQNLGSPLAVQKKEQINIALSDYFNESPLSHFEFIDTTAGIVELTPQLMAIYNLLPNDAIILATCKLHGITTLASHDTDFIIPCKQEGITLLIEE